MFICRYVDIRGALGSPADIAKAIQAIANFTKVENIYVASLGDEIGVTGGNTSAPFWNAFCTARGATAVSTFCRGVVLCLFCVYMCVQSV